MYRVIGTLRSRAFRVVWALEELGVPYELVSAGPHDPAAVAHNPSGKVPVLLVDGTPITDSVAIVQFLADRHGALTHAAGTLARAQQDSMTQFLVEEIEGPLWTSARHRLILPEAERVPAIRPVALADFTRGIAVLEERLGGRPFAAGDTLMVPDLVFGFCAQWAGLARFPIPPGPVRDYAERLQERPAFRRVRALRDG